MNKIIDNHDKSEDLIVRLGKLEEEINSLSKQRNKHNQLTKENLSKRNEALKQINNLLDKAKENKKKRDELNIQVKQLKKKRKKIQNTLQGNKKTLDEIIEKEETTNKTDIQRKRKQMRVLNSKIDKLEWELQTSVLSPDQEKEMVQLLEKYSEQLNTIAEQVHITTQQTSLWKEIASLQKQVNKLYNQIIDYAKESQIYHNLMNQYYHQVNSLRKLEKEHQNLFIKNKKIADNFHRNFLSKVSEKNELRNQLKDFKQKVRKEMREKLKTDVEESTKKAYEKYEKGENLSMEEFRLLVEKGLI
ncbi:MAG: coiled-coil protein [Candidatus Thorarchaeota archaeon]